MYDQRCGYIGCSRGNNLDEVYGSYSAAKAWAWKQCESLCAELEGFNLCITSANTFRFSAQFEFEHPENGRPMVCHITPTSTYAMYLDMRCIEMARFAWREYACKTLSTSNIEQDYISDDGKCHIIWLCHYDCQMRYGDHISYVRRCMHDDARLRCSGRHCQADGLGRDCDDSMR